MTGRMTVTEPTPEQIEAQAAQTRAALDAKLHELERRLSPREQMRRVREQVAPGRYLGLAAVTAVAVGTALAYRGLRKEYGSRETADYCF